MSARLSPRFVLSNKPNCHGLELFSENTKVLSQCAENRIRSEEQGCVEAGDED